MRPKGTPQELEQRRSHAVELISEGHKKADVARMVGATRTSVTRWWKDYQRAGPEGLAAKPHPGPAPKLTVRQKKGLVRRLLKGARANGFGTDLWTCPRIAALIERVYGVRYHVGSMYRFLAALGLSCQKPETPAADRDEQAIARWITKDWVRIKKTPDGGKHT